MNGMCTINGKDAFATWGIVMDSTALSELLTPVPNKEYIENKSRLEHGKRVITANAKKDERDVILRFNMRANTMEEFLEKYASFCEELSKGDIRINTKFQQDVYYNMIYISCKPFTSYSNGRASFALKLCEPNPANRK